MEWRRRVAGISLTGGGVVGKYEPIEDSAQLKRRPGGYTVSMPGSITMQSERAIAGIQGSFKMSPGEFEVGIIRTDPQPFVLRGSTARIRLLVDLDDRLLHEFEIRRLGSGSRPNFEFELALLVVQGGEPMQAGTFWNWRPEISRWCDLLGSVGYSACFFRSFPPLSLSVAHGDRFKAVVEAFQHAERHFLEGRATDAVGQCRVALDAFARVADLGPDFTTNVLGKVLRGCDPEKMRRIKSLFNGINQVANDPHHPRPDEGAGAPSGESTKLVEYDSDEARFVLTVTAAALEFVGRRFRA
jgi:hypothetical protein